MSCFIAQTSQIELKEYSHMYAMDLYTRFLPDSQSPNRKFHSGETATMKIISDWRVALNKETSLHMTEHSIRLIIKVCPLV
jgi:hypothetical protein